MDAGPWSVQDEGASVVLYSEDFTHDVSLVIQGDFRDKAQRIEYAQWLASVLNEYAGEG